MIAIRAMQMTQAIHSIILSSNTSQQKPHNDRLPVDRHQRILDEVLSVSDGKRRRIANLDGVLEVVAIIVNIPQVVGLQSVEDDIRDIQTYAGMIGNRRAHIRVLPVQQID